MSESYVEVREDGSVRLAGTLAYPEATVDDVLTVQADGSIAAAAGGGSVPSGDGSPVGSVVPTGIGQLYVDITNGALWIAIGATNADWIAVGGRAPSVEAGTAFGVSGGDDANGPVISAVATQAVKVTDEAGAVGTGNSLTYRSGAGDGQQSVDLQLGSTGQYDHFWADDGTYQAGNGIIFPSADPHIVGAWWDNGVTLVRSAG